MSQRLQMNLSMAPSEEGYECVICKEPGMDVCVRECLHIFHRRCILNWIQSNKPNCNKCPICLQPLDPQSLVPIDQLLRTLTDEIQQRKYTEDVERKAREKEVSELRKKLEKERNAKLAAQRKNKDLTKKLKDIDAKDKCSATTAELHSSDAVKKLKGGKRGGGKKGPTNELDQSIVFLSDSPSASTATPAAKGSKSRMKTPRTPKKRTVARKKVTAGKVEKGRAAKATPAKSKSKVGSKGRKSR